MSPFTIVSVSISQNTLRITRVQLRGESTPNASMMFALFFGFLNLGFAWITMSRPGVAPTRKKSGGQGFPPTRGYILKLTPAKCQKAHLALIWQHAIRGMPTGIHTVDL